MGLSLLCLLYLYFSLQCYVKVGGLQNFHTIPAPAPSLYTAHSPYVLAKTCFLKPDTGPCRGNIPMYYYSPKEKNCSRFEWGGCQGNGNRFDTYSECRSTCLSTADMRRSAPRYCKLTFDYGYCFGAQKRWYYDRVWKVCKETIYSGCGGNKNNFYGYEQCDSICRLGKDDLIFTTSARHIKKYLIINPRNATAKRGLEQGGGTTTKQRVVDTTDARMMVIHRKN